MADPISAEVEVTVPFHDVDPAGVVWHGRYFKYFELARCALLERLDYSYRQMAESGYVWPVADLEARFTRPVRFEDRIRVVAELLEWEYRLKLSYRVLDQQGRLAARGMTLQVPVDLDSGELVLGSPPVLLAAVRKLLAGDDHA